MSQSMNCRHLAQWVRRWTWLPATSLLLAACGSGAAASSARTDHVASSAKLGDCVHAWNSASLGDGRAQLRAVASSAPHGLAVRFSDGACGLVLPKTTASDGLATAFVRALDGDYAWGMNPQGAAGGTVAQRAALMRRAAKQSNVRVTLATGKLQAIRGKTLPHVKFPAVSSTAKNAGCPTITNPATASNAPIAYTVVHSTASCGQLRELIWAFDANLAKAPPPNPQTILGWTCTGGAAPGLAANQPQASGDIKCEHSSASLEVRVIAPTIATP